MLEIKPVKPNTTELDDFLALPKQIYQPDHLMQSKEEELALIEGSHPLSSDLDIYAFVGYEDGRPCIRGLLTFYSGDEAAYLGFFESINDQQIASAFIEHLAGFARSLGASGIMRFSSKREILCSSQLHSITQPKTCLYGTDYLNHSETASKTC